MKNKIILLLSLSFFAISCEQILNTHLYFKNGIVVLEERSFSGVYLQVDTTGDGTADMWAEILGQSMMHKFHRGDSVSIDIRTNRSFAEPLK